MLSAFSNNIKTFPSGTDRLTLNFAMRSFKLPEPVYALLKSTFKFSNSDSLTGCKATSYNLKNCSLIGISIPFKISTEVSIAVSVFLKYRSRALS
ncbi:hypothetical protein ES708_27646 [subsurface metagenome]